MLGTLWIFQVLKRKNIGDVKLGAGPIIARGANINPKVFAMLVSTAKELDIPYQIEAAEGGTGTDANAMQVTCCGMATGLISVPLRYMRPMRGDESRR